MLRHYTLDGTPAELAMRHLLDQDIWPTAARLNEVAPQFGLRRGQVYIGANLEKKCVGRSDLNGQECRTRELLAPRYGWHRVNRPGGLAVRWEKYEHYVCGSNYCDDPACISNQPDNPEYFPHPEVL